MEQKQRIFMLFFQLHFYGMTGYEQCWKLRKQSFLLRTELLSGVWRTRLKWNKKVSQQLKMNCSTQPGRTSRWKSNKTLRLAARTLHPATIHRLLKDLFIGYSSNWSFHPSPAVFETIFIFLFIYIVREISQKLHQIFHFKRHFCHSNNSDAHGKNWHGERCLDGPMSPARENTEKHLLSHLYRFSLLSGFKIDCGLTESTIIAKRFINIDYGVSKSKSYFL